MLTTSDSKDPLSCSIARGVRLKSLRLMVGFSRHNLENKYGISANTLQSWEKAKAGGLTQKGAVRIISAFQHEGLNCHSEWLLHGIGHPAQFKDNKHYMVRETHAKYIINAPQPNVEPDIVKELLLFRALNPNAIDLIISDDAMAPHYMVGDYVAGKRRTGKDINKLLGMDCIVHTQANEILLRHLLPGTDAGSYHLTCTNIDTTVLEYTLCDRKLISAAPVIWHRKNEPNTGQVKP